MSAFTVSLGGTTALNVNNTLRKHLTKRTKVLTGFISALFPLHRCFFFFLTMQEDAKEGKQLERMAKLPLKSIS